MRTDGTKKGRLQNNHPFPAESEGFEPPIPAIGTPHFECGPIDHSGSFPLVAQN